MRTATPTTMIRFLAIPLLTLPLLALGSCQGDEGDIAAQRQAARDAAHDRRGLGDAGVVVRDTALDARYVDAQPATAEEVAAAIDAIDAEARAIRLAKRIDRVVLRTAPTPIVLGPQSRGDLQIDNTAPLETIQNAVQGSALAYNAARERGVVIADIVAARLEVGTLVLYLAARE